MYHCVCVCVLFFPAPYWLSVFKRKTQGDLSTCHEIVVLYRFSWKAYVFSFDPLKFHRILQPLARPPIQHRNVNAKVRQFVRTNGDPWRLHIRALVYRVIHFTVQQSLHTRSPSEQEGKIPSLQETCNFTDN